MFPSIFRYIPCSRKVSSHLIKAVAFYENSEIGGVFVTIRFVRVAERILINLIVEPLAKVFFKRLRVCNK